MRWIGAITIGALGGLATIVHRACFDVPLDCGRARRKAAPEPERPGVNRTAGQPEIPEVVTAVAAAPQVDKCERR
ncbi:MAG TPA: hypothetical protein VKB79_15255 [Bryobacteraceae bacterium]|nr:hypothetical protein [Bryobacteraceae bacterium]